MTNNDSANDAFKRETSQYKSIRSLPKGNFQKYRQLFETTNEKNKQPLNEFRVARIQQQKTILELPVTDDEKQSHLNKEKLKPVNELINEEKPKKFIFGYENEVLPKPTIEWSPNTLATRKKIEIINREVKEAPLAPAKPPRTFEYEQELKLESFKTDLDQIFNLNTINEFRVESPQSSIKQPEIINEPIDHPGESRNEKTKSVIYPIKPKALKNKSNLKNLSKLTASEPNLTTNSKKGNLFSRAFRKIKESISKTNLNEINETRSLESDSLDSESESQSSSSSTSTEYFVESDDKHIIYETITKRVEKNRKNYQDLFENQAIYTNPRELMLKSLFDYCLVVTLKQNDKDLDKRKSGSTLKLNDSKSLIPYVLWKFPDKIPNFESKIVEFCFPESTNEMKQNESDIFQFILTNFDGTRTYGFCLKIFSKTPQPIVYCIVSPVDASELFNTILLETKNIHLNEENEDLDDTKCLLSALYSKPLPKRGEILQVTFGTRNIRKLDLKRSLDRRLEHIHVDLVLQLSYDLIIKIFSSMLAEKKLIFLSNKLSSLSNTIQAFETLLYPFNWPHTFIPVLPSYLIEMCEAPTPYVIGLLRHNKNDLTKLDLSEVLIVDLDKNRCIQEDGSEMNILPNILSNKLKQKLHNLSLQKQTKNKFEDDKRRNRLLLNAFIDIFVYTIGHYNDYFYICESTKTKKFNYKSFILNSRSIQLQDFLEWFTKTQLFEVFIANKCSESVQFGLAFENAIKARLKARSK